MRRQQQREKEGKQNTGSLRRLRLSLPITLIVRVLEMLLSGEGAWNAARDKGMGAVTQCKSIHPTSERRCWAGSDWMRRICFVFSHWTCWVCSFPLENGIRGWLEVGRGQKCLFCASYFTCLGTKTKLFAKVSPRLFALHSWFMYLYIYRY